MPSDNAFQLSDEAGFLARPKPYNLPPRPAWAPYIDIVRMVEDGANGAAYRDAVDQLEKRDGAKIAAAAAADVALLDEDDVRWLYSTFTFVCQKYVHGDPPSIRDVLPELIGLPWGKLSAARGAPMAMTYDALVIGNWRLKDTTKAPTIDNIEVALVVRGTTPEKGFVVVHMAMEASAASWPLRMLSLHEELLTSAQPAKTLLRFLDECPARIGILTEVLAKMWKMCEHPDYWAVVRATLMGFPEAAFPNGLQIRNHPEIVPDRKGGSGAQSPLMHAVDSFLGVDHRDENLGVDTAADHEPPAVDNADRAQRIRSAIHKQQQLPAHAQTFFHDQKNYMCAAHRDYFFTRLDARPTLRDLVIRYGDDECVKHYNLCIELLTKMRKVHQLIAHKYIAEKAVAIELDQQSIAQAAGGVHLAGTVSGVGGSNFVSLLNQAIAETAKAALDLKTRAEAPPPPSWRIPFTKISLRWW